MREHNTGGQKSNRQSGRARLGCLGMLLFAFVVVLLVTVGLFPWAFHIGGRFTPFTIWTGYGRLHSSDGTNYGLYLRLMLPTRGGRAGNRFSNNLTGSALLCTPRGSTFPYRLSGGIHKVWLDTEGKGTDLSLRMPPNEKPDRGFDLHGVWRNGELVLDDKGSLSHAFDPGGTPSPKGRYSGVPRPGEHAGVTVAFGTQQDFEALCKNQLGAGR
jgi:hypothetical protein